MITPSGSLKMRHETLMLCMARGDEKSKLPINVLWLPHPEAKIKPEEPKNSYSDQCAR